MADAEVLRGRIDAGLGVHGEARAARERALAILAPCSRPLAILAPCSRPLTRAGD